MPAITLRPRKAVPAPRNDDSVEILAELASLEDLAPFWRASTENDDSPFSTFDWNRAWLRHRAPGRCDEIIIAVVRKAGQIRAIFPLVRTGRRLDFAGSEICDFQDVIAPDPEAALEGVESLLQWMKAENLDLGPSLLSNRGKLEQVLMRRDWRNGFLMDRAYLGPCPWLEIRGGDFTEITGQFSKNTRKKTRRWHRILQEGPGATQRIVDRVDGEFLDRAARMHQALQAGKSGDSVFDDPSLKAFLLEVAHSDEVGLLGAIMESDAGDWLTFDLGFARMGRFHAWLCAYHLDFAQYRPGQVSFALLLEQLSRRDICIFDLLCGGDLYKFHYATHEYKVHKVRVLRKTPANVAAALKQKADNRLRPIAKRVLHKLGLYKTHYRID